MISEDEVGVVVRHVPRLLKDAMDLRASQLGLSRERMLLDLFKEEFSRETTILVRVLQQLERE